MPVVIKSVKGYYFLDVWVLANIIQLSTLEFCRRFLNRTNDPCGRLHDQMTMAARSVPANIAEGLSRSQTSKETEMKLTDVARASLSELLGDYFFISMANRIEPWSCKSREYVTVADVRFDRPEYTDDWQREAWLHIMQQKAKFDPWVQHEDISVCVNAMMVLCNRAINMLNKLISTQLDAFKENGGFSENLTEERLTTIKTKASNEGAPPCPVCGGPMQRRMAKRGRNQGNEFWSCTNYPQCNGTRSIGKT